MARMSNAITKKQKQGFIATEDDLRGLYELLQVVAVRRFGLDLTEREGE